MAESKKSNLHSTMKPDKLRFSRTRHCKVQELFAIVCYIDGKTLRIEVITSDYLNMDIKGKFVKKLQNEKWKTPHFVSLMKVLHISDTKYGIFHISVYGLFSPLEQTITNICCALESTGEYGKIVVHLVSWLNAHLTSRSRNSNSSNSKSKSVKI